MTPAQAAEARDAAAEARARAKDLTVMADLLDRRVQHAGYPAATELAKVIAFPVERRRSVR